MSEAARALPTRVMTVEDDPRYRESLLLLLQHSQGFEAAGSFGNAEAMLREAGRILESANELPWDLALMDLELPEMDGIEATRRLKELAPDLPVVVLTSFEEPATILQAICVGAEGYLLKKASARELVAHMRTIVDGGSSLSGEVAKSVLSIVRKHGVPEAAPSSASKPNRLSLSEREQQVVRCLADGQTYDQVAAALEISAHTVRGHIRRIYKKLQVHSAAEAVSRAVREGLI